MFIKAYSMSEILLGLGEIFSPISSRIFILVRSSGPIRATMGLLSLIKNPTQLFPENKFHDHAKKKQDFF